jgi:tetratricopeptide (TPR) repeat protein
VKSRRSHQRAKDGHREAGPLARSGLAWRFGVCLLLAAIVWAVFGQTLGHQFINYDDPLYVLENPHVNAGLSWRSVGWAFTHVHSQNWHPLTTISHMLDSQFFGLNAGWHHFTNVLLHFLAAILLFLALERMTPGPSSPRFESVRPADRTGDIWPSAFVAAIFAVHPLRVESVAWISERKDVLSGVFFMLTLLCYARYAERRTIGRYVVVAIAFVCGLMSKPMVITTPVVLLLLDYWPLGRQTSEVRGQRSERLERPSFAKLFLEKIPLFGLAAGSVIATLLAQNFALGSPAHLPIAWRLTNAIVTYWDYIWQMFWPIHLVPFYLHPEGRLPLGRLVFAAAILVLITAVVFLRRRKNPYLMVGWLWYLVMLVPVIGVIQVGLQGRADRYTYLPHIGLFIALTWLVRDLTARWQQQRVILAAGAAGVVIALSLLAWKQTTRWHDTETLWRYTLGVSDTDVARVGLAGILAVKGQTNEAIEHYERAIQMRSGNAGAQDGLARVLAGQQKVDAAIEHWKKALEIQPDNLPASNALALMFVHRGEYANAVAQWQNTLAFDPDNADAANNLAWVLASTTDNDLRNPAKALELAQRAAKLTNQKNPAVLRTLTVAYGENRQFNEAIATAERALHLAEFSGNSALAADLRRCLELFKNGKSWSEGRGQPGGEVSH